MKIQKTLSSILLSSLIMSPILYSKELKLNDKDIYGNICPKTGEELTPFEDNILKLINESKFKFSKTKFKLNSSLQKSADLRTEYLTSVYANNPYDMRIDIEKDSSNPYFTGNTLSSRIQSNKNGINNNVINEITFTVNKNPLITFNNIMSNPFYRNSLLNPLSDNIGIVANNDFITIYTSSSFFQEFCDKNFKMPSNVEVDKNICKFGPLYEYNMDVDNVYDDVKSKESDFFYDQTIYTYPENHANNVKTSSINFLNYKYINTPETIIGNPISINVLKPLPVDEHDKKLFNITTKLFEVHEGTEKEITNIKILNRLEHPNNPNIFNPDYSVIENRNNNVEYNLNFINADDIIIQPMDILKYNTKYIVKMDFDYIKEPYDSYVKEFGMNSRYFKKYNKTFEFKTENIGSPNSKIIYIDDLNSNSFELSKNKEYVLVSKYFLSTSFNCEKNKIEKLERNAIIVKTSTEEECQITDNILHKNYNLSIK
jgi:hypothetical protein